jgi:hypothetical protein
LETIRLLLPPYFLMISTGRNMWHLYSSSFCLDHNGIAFYLLTISAFCIAELLTHLTILLLSTSRCVSHFHMAGK